MIKQRERKSPLQNWKAGFQMKEGNKRLNAKIVAAMLESIIVFLETVKDVEKTIELIRKMQKRLSE